MLKVFVLSSKRSNRGERSVYRFGARMAVSKGVSRKFESRMVEWIIALSFTSLLRIDAKIDARLSTTGPVAVRLYILIWLGGRLAANGFLEFRFESLNRKSPLP